MLYKMPYIFFCLKFITFFSQCIPSPTAFPLGIIQGLPNVALLLTAHGGHIAFLDGLFPRGETYMERLFGQFIQAVFEHPKDINKACGIKEEQMSWSSFTFSTLFVPWTWLIGWMLQRIWSQWQ